MDNCSERLQFCSERQRCCLERQGCCSERQGSCSERQEFCSEAGILLLSLPSQGLETDTTPEILLWFPPVVLPGFLFVFLRKCGWDVVLNFPWRSICALRDEEQKLL